MLEEIDVEGGICLDEYPVSSDVDGFNYPSTDKLLELFWRVKSNMDDINDIGSSIKKIEFPVVYLFDGTPILTITDAESEIYCRDFKNLDYVTGANGSACAINTLYNSLYNTINELYRMEIEIDNFQFDYVGFNLNYHDSAISDSEEIVNYEYEAYQEAEKLLRGMNGDYIKNEDGSITYCCEDGGSITIREGKIVCTKNPNGIFHEKRVIDDDVYICSEPYSTITYFADGKPYAVELKDIHALVNYSDKDNITYNWIPRNDYKYLPSIKDGTVDTKICYVDSWTWLDTIKYEGEYLYFNVNNFKINVPLGKICVKDETVTTESFSALDRIKYIDTSTRYVNDTMNNFNNNSTPYFHEVISDRLKTITLVYIDESAYDYIDDGGEFAAFCRGYNLMTRSDIVVDMGECVCINESGFGFFEYNYDYLVDSMPHEMGHAFGDDTIFLHTDMDQITVWKNIYEELSNDHEKYETILRPYSFTNNQELFADSVMYYYTDPERLKMIEIESSRSDNLYDYMDYILNDKGSIMGNPIGNKEEGNIII